MASVAVAPSAMPSRGGGRVAAATNARESRWQRDMGAYKRLRQNGVQPKGIDGCGDIEQHAESKVEVEQLRPMTSVERHAYESVSSDLGLGGAA